MLSVCSYTVQASVINLCKYNKAFFKSQNQQNTLTEEEEESHDNDESSKAIEYLNDCYYSSFVQSGVNFKWYTLFIYFPSSTLQIQIPPPKK